MDHVGVITHQRLVHIQISLNPELGKNPNARPLRFKVPETPGKTSTIVSTGDSTASVAIRQT